MASYLLKIKSANLHLVFLAFFLLNIISNIAARILHVNQIDLNLRISSLTNIFFELVFIVIVIFNFKKCKIYIFYILALTIIFLLGLFLSQDFLSLRLEKFTDLHRSNFYFFNSFLYIIIYVAAFKFVKQKEILLDRIFKLLVWFLILNSILIFLALIFNWTVFLSYPQITGRFGYTGLYYSRINIYYLYIFGIIIEYKNFLKNKKFIKLIIFIVSLLFIGKKASFVFIALLGLIYFFNAKKSNLLKSLSLLVIIIPIIFFDKIVAISLELFPFWKTLYKSNGLTTVIFSYRNISLKKLIEFILQKWDFMNYLFGTIDFSHNKTEMEFIDVFAFWGIIGFIIYLLFIYKEFFKKLSVLDRLIVVSIFITTSISSIIMINVNSIIILFLLTYYLNKKRTKKLNKNESENRDNELDI